MKHLLLAGLLLLSVPAFADQPRGEDDRGRPNRDIFGIEAHPYIAFNFDRVSEPAQWTAGTTGGLTLEESIFAVWLGYTINDVFTDIEVVPWDGTAFAKFGLQDRIGRISSVPVSAHVNLGMVVPTGPDKLTLAFESGFEFDVDPLYVGASYITRDIWLNDDDEVYPWNHEFGIQLGIYW